MGMVTFGPWDYVVFGLMLAGSTIIGIYYAVKARKGRSTNEYLVASNSMTFLPVALSLIATSESSVMMLGSPAESYAFGIELILGEIGNAVGTIIEVIVTLTFLKRLNLSTPFEYFERRFRSRRLRLITHAVTWLHYLQYMSVVIYGQAIAIEQVTGLSMFAAMAVTTSITVIYTSIGGLKAVMWTDVMQLTLMVAGMLMVIIKGTLDAGGIAEVWGRASDTGRLTFSLDHDPTVRHTVWNLFFGRILAGFGYLYMPSSLQRISSAKSLGETRRALLVTIPAFPILLLIGLSQGIVAYGYYYHIRCDPVASKQVNSLNQILPFFIMDLFHNVPGMSGFFLAALSSASLSTVSSCLSAVAHITWYDIVKPCRPNMSEFKGVLVAKVTVVIAGVLSCVLAVIVSSAGSKSLHQIVYTLLSTARSPLNALFYLGALFPFANAKGAITGLLAGVSFMLWLSLGSMFSSAGSASNYLPSAPTDNCPGFNVTTPSFVNSTLVPEQEEVDKNRSGLDAMYSLSYTLFTSIAIATVLLVGSVTSLLTGGNRTPADPDCLIHLKDIQCWCVPDTLRSTSTTCSGIYELSPVRQDDTVDGEDLVGTDLTRPISAKETVLAESSLS
ncbi:sodium-coupled monocarboxylate transporter 2-like [Haliotis asinina]|uniref:sodium-coupled monocarboxylate transporter 2-like n=1 Tax=Haliotis asinina TaxID=109174 RepID=UPI003531890B